MDNLNPDWKPVEIGMNKLFANDNPDCTFKIECWDWEK